MVVGSAINGPDPLDPRVKPASTGQPGTFSLRDPRFFYFRRPVLPPHKTLSIQS
jgi:hypothetical protein